jgi:membrane-bound ClpP family serine protease
LSETGIVTDASEEPVTVSGGSRENSGKSLYRTALLGCLALALVLTGLMLFALDYSPALLGIVAVGALVAFLVATDAIPFYKSAGWLILAVLGTLAMLSLLQALWTFGNLAF